MGRRARRIGVEFSMFIPGRAFVVLAILTAMYATHMLHTLESLTSTPDEYPPHGYAAPGEYAPAATTEGPRHGSHAKPPAPIQGSCEKSASGGTTNRKVNTSGTVGMHTGATEI